MQPLVSLCDLSRSFTQRQGLFSPRREVFAVNRVNLALFPGETLGLVGESGCGKSTLARMVVGLLAPTSGDVLFEEKSLFHPAAGEKQQELRKGLCRKIQMVFQDPFSSLNPRMRVGESVGEPLRCAANISHSQREAAVIAMLERVGLDKEHMHRCPHEFSGGQRQRIAIARALVTHPAFVVCDEPTSSLDSSVQAQVLNLLAELQEQLGLTYLFISHDLAVVRHMSDRVAVMYAGLIVEEASTSAIFSHPQHPYTRLLLDSTPGTKTASPRTDTATPRTDTAPREITAVQEPTTASQKKPPAGIPATGCPFAPRCPRKIPVCENILPDLISTTSVAGTAQTEKVRCHNPL